MMHMPWVVVLLIIFIVVVGGGAFLAMRVMGGRSTRNDHP